MTRVIEYSEGDLRLAETARDKGDYKGQKVEFFLECVKERIATKDVPIEPKHVMKVIKECVDAGLDPTSSEVYAFLMRDKRGQVHLTIGVTVDGWAKALDNRQCSVEFKSHAKGKIKDKVFDSELECIITRPNGSHVSWKVNYSEARVAGNELWISQPQQMMQVRALARCARIAVGMGAIYDIDEAKAFFNTEVRNNTNVEAHDDVVEDREVEEEEKKNETPQLEMKKAEELELDLNRLSQAKNKSEARQLYAQSAFRTDPEFAKRAQEIARTLPE